MATNQYQAFAAGGGANTLTAAQWAALASLIANGFTAGTAASNQFNTLMRQVSVITSSLAQLATDQAGVSMNDDGNVAEAEANFLTLFQKLGRQKITGTTTLYVSPTGSDTTGTGTTGNPFATVTGAWSYAVNNFDMGMGGTFAIQVENGTYSSGINLIGMPIGASQQVIQITGNTATPASVLISTSNGQNGVTGLFGAQANLSGIAIAASGTTGPPYNSSANGVVAEGQAFIGINGPFQMGLCSGAQFVASSGGRVTFTPGVSVSVIGNASACLIAADQGEITVSGASFVLSGAPTWSTAFAVASRGTIQAGPAVNSGGSPLPFSYSGSGSGPRYYAGLQGLIQTNGSGTTLFPGSSGGTADSTTYGLYL